MTNNVNKIIYARFKHNTQRYTFIYKKNAIIYGKKIICFHIKNARKIIPVTTT